MKIGFDAKRAFQNSSGLGNYSRNTLNALNNYFPDNNYLLFTPKVKPKLFETHGQFKTVSPPLLYKGFLKSLWRTFSLARRLKKSDLELFHGLSNELPSGIHKTGIPAVVTIHDLIFMRSPEFYKPLDRKIYFRKMKYACNSANKIIAISRQTKNDIETFFQVAPGKIKIIHQPVAATFFEKQNPIKVFTEHIIPENYILSVGTIEPRKNQLALLKAVQNSKIGIPIVFVGKPTSYISELKKFIDQNNMHRQVFFLSGLAEDELAALYQNALFSVYISVFEGFGLPIIESMASGCPVLTSSVSCLPETAGDAAVLCDPANGEEIGEKLKSLLDDETLRKQIIQKGVDRAKDFHPEIYAQKLISLYTSLLK
jgi:glycosyltransferase involved in cell wall biosynthesis